MMAAKRVCVFATIASAQCLCQIVKGLLFQVLKDDDLEDITAVTALQSILEIKLLAFDTA